MAHWLAALEAAAGGTLDVQRVLLAPMVSSALLASDSARLQVRSQACPEEHWSKRRCCRRARASPRGHRPWCCPGAHWSSRRCCRRALRGITDRSQLRATDRHVATAGT